MFSQDFLNETFLEVMSPQTLYFYRATNKYTYHYITMDKIKNKIIQNIHKELKLRLGDKYDLLNDCMNKRQLILRSEFITNCIWETYDDMDIDFYIFEKEMGTVEDNIFEDLQIKNITYQNIQSYLNFETSWYIKLNTKLYVEVRCSYNHNDIDWDYDPELFRCTYNQNKNILYLPYLSSIMHKKLVIRNNTYYDSEDENYKDCIDLCKKYDIDIIDYYQPK